MKVPQEIRTYCPYCGKHTIHKVKLPKKGKPRTLALGNLRHEKKLKGHGGKRAGEKSVKKHGKRQKVMLICQECGKAHERVIGTRTKKKIELKR